MTVNGALNDNVAALQHSVGFVSLGLGVAARDLLIFLTDNATYCHPLNLQVSCKLVVCSLHLCKMRGCKM